MRLFLVLFLLVSYPSWSVDVVRASYDNSAKFYSLNWSSQTYVGTSFSDVCSKAGGTLEYGSNCAFNYKGAVYRVSISYNYCYANNYWKTEPYSSVCPKYTCPPAGNPDYTVLSDSAGIPDSSGLFCSKDTLCDSFKGQSVSPDIDMAKFPTQICYEGCLADNSAPMPTGQYLWVQPWPFSFNGKSCSGNSGWVKDYFSQNYQQADSSSKEASKSQDSAKADADKAAADKAAADASTAAAAASAAQAKAAADAAKALADAAAKQAQVAANNVTNVYNNSNSTVIEQAAASENANAAAQAAKQAAEAAQAAIAQAQAAAAQAAAAAAAQATANAAMQAAAEAAQAAIAQAQAAAAQAQAAYEAAIAAAESASAQAAEAAVAAAAKAAAAAQAAANAAAQAAGAASDAAGAAGAAADAATNASGGGSGGSSGGGSGDSNTDVPDETETASKFCKANPTALACATLGNFESPTLGDPQEINFQVNPASGFGSSNSACPAPKKETVFGTEVVLRNEAICQLGSMLRPLVIGLAFVAAAMIVLVGNKGGD